MPALQNSCNTHVCINVFLIKKNKNKLRSHNCNEVGKWKKLNTGIWHLYCNKKLWLYFRVVVFFELLTFKVPRRHMILVNNKETQIS